MGMDWLKIAQEIFLMVLTILVFPLIKDALSMLREYWKSKIKIDKGQDILSRAYDAVSTSVGYVMQTFVDNVKGTDQWNIQKMQEAAFTALMTAKTLLGKDALKILGEVVGNIDDWLKTAIEDEVNIRKQIK